MDEITGEKQTDLWVPKITLCLKACPYSNHIHGPGEQCYHSSWLAAVANVAVPFQINFFSTLALLRLSDAMRSRQASHCQRNPLSWW